ncbi:uncharacterized protein FOBCDRAFT_279486 [Fusarium oxysporum Fo47]|uniref:uncharacterized protein n=1 Tax=Fusarium oxysporum Fo47 TaxID=660027 RepID=UPI002869AF9B|nr:uncharacterized protein FOBCDRAFT_279486 [Fusarium oxysporum Fo47]QKD59885.2 hypothetical protein FOBCDRAFT_279486 [Fusarium oxysporum Fo47]
MLSPSVRYQKPCQSLSRTIVDVCTRLLEEIQTVLLKYHALDDKNGKARKIWKRLRWEPDDVKDMRQRLTSNIVLLSTINDTLNGQYLAKVQEGIDKLHDFNEDQEFIRTHGNPLFYSLQQLLNLDTLGTVKWFLTSRDVPEIRSVKDAFKAVEISPNLTNTSKDIRAFLDAQRICPTHDEPWFDTDEHKFLYAALICEIAKNKAYRTKQGAIDALKSFPRGLEDCYIKSRTFRILTLSEKELTLMELIDALKSYTDPANDGIKSKKDALRVYDRVKDVCSPLITMEDTNDSQKISQCHKSVKDFFIDPKNKRRIEEYLPDFIDENKALEELGVSCIEYLSEERYQVPSDLKALVTRSESSYNNAFLRYAAVLWHMHMQDITPSSETLKTVEDFLKSPAFWPCIYVQSHAAPHLFARYKRETSHYKPILGTIPNAGLQFALPLPPWKEDSSSADYVSLDRSFCAFVLDWGELLTKNPDQLHHAVPLTLYKPSCHLKAPSGLQKFHIKYVAKLLESTTEMRVLESSFSSTGKKRGKTLQLQVIRENGLMPHRWVKVNQVDVFSRSKSDQNREVVLDSSAPDSECITTIARDSKKGDSFLQSWKVNSRDLSITRCLLGDASGNRVDQAPPQVCRDLDLGLDGKGQWNLVQIDVVTQPTRKDSDSTTRLFYFRKGQCLVHPHERAKSPNNVIVSNSDSQDSSSDSDGDFGWSSDSDDDSDSSDTHSINGERNESLETSDILDGGRKEPMTECLIVANDFGRPVWRPIQTDHLSWSRIIGTRHPALPIVAVSYKFGGLDLLNDDSGSSTSLEISEKGQNKTLEPVAVSREVQFSPCGKFLTLLSISLYQKDVRVECQVTVSCFEFLQTTSGYSFQTRKNGILTSFSYRFLGKVDELPRPYIMTNWTAEYVVLALPPLTYSPKIIKISLSPV